ncbi:MAG: O-methyltransferase [Lachnospirales bacterium]
MLVEKYLEDYVLDMLEYCDGELGKLQKESYELGLPIIPKDVVKLLGFILGIKKPVKILEIGMAVGFSASYMSQFLPPEGHITTIDRYPLMIEKAKANFKRFNLEDKITIIEGDANEVLKNLDDEFDFVFMDAAKGQYINILPDVLRLLKVGGIIMADDILQEGRVAMDYYEIPKRQRTIHKRLNEFLHTITHRADLRTSILTIGDGVALIEKLRSAENE